MRYSWHLATCVAIIVLLSATFYCFPELDIATSSLFFKNGAFVMTQYHWAVRMPHVVNIIMIITALVLLTGIVVGLCAKRFRQRIKPFSFVLLCFLLGPGLLVNGILKSEWGRPRPYKTTIFQGEKQYQKVWQVSQQCAKNCSFVCGDCAGMFGFIAIAFVANRKRLVCGLVIPIALFFSLLRLSLGRHFLSDMLLAFSLDYLVILILYYFFYLSPLTQSPENQTV